MSDIPQSVLQHAGVKSTPFAPSSRYAGIETASLEGNEADPILFLRRRIVPPAERFSLLQVHTVTEKDRPDTIAAQYIGDPERFWQICDANNCMEPGDLTQKVGDKIKITLPDGIPGNSNA